MVYERVQLAIRPDRLAAFESAFDVGKVDIESAPGCVSVELFRSLDQPATYLLQVGWNEVRDHTENFVGSPPHARFSAVLGAYITDACALAHYGAVPI